MVLGWHTQNPVSLYSDGHCELDYLNHFQISPEGNVFLCSHTYPASDAIGSVLDNTSMTRPDVINNYVQWYTAQPFDDPKCVDCVFLPICMGGCRKARTMGHPMCVEEAGHLQSYVQDVIQERVSAMVAEIGSEDWAATST